MKEKIEKVVMVLCCIFILYVIFAPHIIIEIWNVQSGKKPFYERAIDSIKNSIDDSINKDKYNKIINEYINEYFGEKISKKFKIIENKGYYYKIRFDEIMENYFMVNYSKNDNACSTNINNEIKTDKKFHHLYSEWIKKQVGIEDEGVELKLNFPKDRVEFKNIDSLSEDCHEIFENYPYSLQYIAINRQIDETEKVKIFQEYFNNFYERINKVKNNTFEIQFNNDFKNYISIKDYKGSKLFKVSNKNKEPTLNVICNYNQLKNIIDKYQTLSYLKDSIVPKYYKNCEVKHWLLTEDVDDSGEMIKTPDGKYYQDNIIRLDISNNNEFIVDILYCGLADDIRYVYDKQSQMQVPLKKYKRYGRDGKRIDVYYDIRELRNPLFVRYKIKYDAKSFQLLESKTITKTEYFGEEYKYVYE